MFSAQVEGQAKQQKGEAEYDASHATAKLPGGITASSSGAVTKDHPDRTAGSWNQTAGSAKEFVGGVVGSEVCGFFYSSPHRYKWEGETTDWCVFLFLHCRT